MRKLFLMIFLVFMLAGQRGVYSQEEAPTATLQFSPPMDVVKPDPLLELAREQLAQGKIRDARSTAKTFLDKNGKSAEGWTILADIYAEMGARGKARRRYKKALKFDPHFGSAYFGLGQLFEKKGKLDEAANEYRAAALLRPNDSVIQQALLRVAGSGSSNE